MKSHVDTSTKESWLEELDCVLATLDGCQLECDGMTYAISHLLGQAGIEHRARTGYTQHRGRESFVLPHCWVELPDDVVIDYRLRMWLGDDDSIPHGVFRLAEHPDLEYRGRPLETTSLPSSFVSLLTDGIVDTIHVPPKS